MERMCGGADIRRARELLDSDQSFEALPILQRAFQDNPCDPTVKSYYGLVTALERGQVRQSIELCLAAVDGDPGSADLYLNLARVYLKAGRRGEAVRALRDGVERDNVHEGLLRELHRLGIRRPPIFGSLPRSHPLNKYAGIAAARLGLR